MLSTPLGDIIILIDNKAISYNAIPVNRDKTIRLQLNLTLHLRLNNTHKKTRDILLLKMH